MKNENRTPANLEEVSEKSRFDVLSELLGFLKHNKKWWLLPILLMIGTLGALVTLTATGAAPLIYTLF